MGRQLVNTNVEFISLVKKGANGEKVEIFKSADAVDPNATETPAVVENVAPAVVEAEDPEMSTVKKFFETMKNFFGGQKTEVVAKSQDLPYVEDYTSFTARITNERGKVRDAMYVLEDVIYSIFWDDSIQNGKELILKNIDEFKAYLTDMFSQTVEVQKEAFAKEDTEMKKEDIQAILNEALAPVTKSLEDLTTKVTAMEKQEEVPAAPAATTPEDKPAEEVAKSAEPKVEDVIKAALAEAIAPIAKSIEGLGERVETVENFRGISKGSDAQEVKKSGDIWDGVLPFVKA